MFPVAINASECIGHIFFYNLEEGRGEADADSDFAYYFHKVTPLLTKEGVSYSAHTELPLSNKTCFSPNVVIPKEDIEISLGYIFVKPNFDKKVIGGVLTGMDISDVVNEFFK